jgi:hypothetical protein
VEIYYGWGGWAFLGRWEVGSGIRELEGEMRGGRWGREAGKRVLILKYSW